MLGQAMVKRFLENVMAWLKRFNQQPTCFFVGPKPPRKYWGPLCLTRTARQAFLKKNQIEISFFERCRILNGGGDCGVLGVAMDEEYHKFFKQMESIMDQKTRFSLSDHLLWGFFSPVSFIGP